MQLYFLEAHANFNHKNSSVDASDNLQFFSYFLNGKSLILFDERLTKDDKETLKIFTRFHSHFP